MGKYPVQKGKAKRKSLFLAEAFLIAFVVIVFCLAAWQSMDFLIMLDRESSSFDRMTGENPNSFLFSSLITMVISGLGLILLLLLKLKNISAMYAHNKTLQEQFFQAQKAEALGRLAGGIAHDFNNILSSIMGYTGFLLDDLKADSEQHHFAQQIQQGSLQARGLVEQILAFSRREENIREPIDMAEAIRDTTDMLKSTFSDRIKLDVRIEETDSFIEGSPSQIGQVLMNLCVNAKDSMEAEKGHLMLSVACMAARDMTYKKMLVTAGTSEKKIPPVQFYEAGEEVVVTVGTLQEDSRYVQVTISDTGKGMSRDVMEHMFEPFYTTKDVDKGTGLGLASVHGIMAEYQGAILVKSEQGLGTTFTLYFPVAEGFHSILAPASDTIQSDKGGGTILIVDDQDSVRKMLEKMLTRLGYEVKSCSSGYDTIDHLRENITDYDLVISDFSMPQMTGVEMAQEIQNDFPDLPIILITGYSQEKLEDLVRDIPAVRSILRKPLESKDLNRAIEDVLKLSGKAVKAA